MPTVLTTTDAAVASIADHAVLHEQLTRLWRETVDRLTVLSIELHTRADDPDDPAVAALDAELAALRRTMSEVEDALRSLS